MLEQIRIVLVNTSHTGNIGSVARAMKTMGLSELVLVDPVQAPDSHASALAAGATDVLHQAKIVDTLAEAIDDCTLVIGTSARSRTIDWPMLGPREAATQALAEVQSGKVALVFGRERSGLTNDELSQCTHHMNVPTNPEYSSLNLAMAVQTLTYELRMQYLEANQQPEAEDTEYPRMEELELFYEHLEKTLLGTGFIIKQHPGQVLLKLKRLFARARPDATELNILRGILTSIDKQIGLK